MSYIRQNIKIMRFLLDHDIPENYELQVFKFNDGYREAHWKPADRQDTVDFPYLCEYRIGIKGHYDAQ